MAGPTCVRVDEDSTRAGPTRVRVVDPFYSRGHEDSTMAGPTCVRVDEDSTRAGPT